MPILVRLTVANPDDILDGYGAGAKLRLERAATVDGTYAEVATDDLLSGILSYEIWDASGTSDSWYRSRYSNSAGSVFSDYSDPFTPGAPVAYATLDDLMLTMRQNVTDTRFLARADEVLAEVSRDLTRQLGYSFFRQPASGSEDVIFDGPGGRRLHVHGSAPRVGVVAVGAVEIRYRRTDAWTTLDAADWRLEGNPGLTGVEAGDPFFHVALTDGGTYGAFPRGMELVRLTGAVFGWPAINRDHREAAVAWARQRLAADPSMPGGQLGPDAYGQPVAPDRWPRPVYDLVMAEKSRHECWR